MPSPISRRDALKLAAAGGFALALRGLAIAADAQPDRKIRLAVIGVGSRGTVLLRHVLDQDSAVEIPALCDIDEQPLKRASDMVEKSRGKRPEGYSKGPEDFRRLLQRDDLDAVMIVTPHDWHHPMAVAAMKAGKFVGSEVPAACTVDECWDLVRTQRSTKTGYMMLENLCYVRPAMQVLNMARKGLFGDFTYAYGGYIHETRNLRFASDGSLTWRGENLRKLPGVIYPTHALGPIAWWMDLRKDDKFLSMVAMSSKPAALHQYAIEKFGPDSPQARIEWANGDTSQALIKTARGRLIELRYDVTSPRPSGMGSYSLQGTKGAYESAFGQNMVYLEGRTPGEKWEPLEQYQNQFDHPRWLEQSDKASTAGHGGGDFFVLADFLAAIRTGQSPIDVIDAVTWSVIRPLSAESLAGGSKPVDIPDFQA